MPIRATHLAATPEEVWVALAGLAGDGAGPAGRRWPTGGATVLESAPPRRLLLETRLGPLAAARVELRLAHSGTGTDLVIDADAGSGAVSRPALRLIGGVVLALCQKRFLSQVRRGTARHGGALWARRPSAVAGRS